MADKTSLLIPIRCTLCGGEEFSPTVHALNDAYLPHLGGSLKSSRWVICRDCGLVFQNPRPSGALMEKLYAGGFYHSLNQEKFSAAFLQTKRAHVEKQLDWVRKRIDIAAFPLKRALDVGCGVGVSLDVLRRQGWEVHGFEPDPELAAFGKKEFGLDIVRQPFKDGLFPPDHFTLVYTHHSYEHLDDPLELTRWLRKITAPQAVLFFAVPTYPRSFHFFPWEWMNLPHTTIFSHRTFARLLAEAGFRLQDYHYDPYGELWVLARPVDAAGAKPRGARPWLVQAELWLSPLLFFVGLFHRGLRRLFTDPMYLFKRLARSLRR